MTGLDWLPSDGGGRRRLLVGLLGLAAGAKALHPIESFAAPTVFPEPLLRMMAEVIAIAERTRIPGFPFSAASPELTSAFDRLVGHLLDNYDGQVDQQALKVLLCQPARAMDLPAISLTQHLRAILPVAVVRDLLGNHGVPFDSTACPQYSRFVDRYGSAILSVDAVREDHLSSV